MTQPAIPSSIANPVAATTAAAPTSPTAPSTTTAAGDSGTSAVTLAYIKPPPSIVFPQIPEGFISLPAQRYRAQLPKKEELAYMPEVVTEMARFADYAEVFGKTAPSHPAASQTLTAAYQWAALRGKLAQWDAYSQTLEAVAWVQARALIDRLRPAFALAAAGDTSLTTVYPNLAQLFGVSKAIARRAVATREANKTEVAAGRSPFKGSVGKARKKKAANEALATQEAAAQQAASAIAKATPPVTVAVPVPPASMVASPAIAASAVTPIPGMTALPASAAIPPTAPPAAAPAVPVAASEAPAVATPVAHS